MSILAVHEFDTSSGAMEKHWHEIKNSIHNAMNMFIPKVRLRRHQFPCWYTPELRHLSKCLRSAKKRFSRHATPHLQLKINDLESEYRSKTLLAKSNYESQLLLLDHTTQKYMITSEPYVRIALYPLLFLSITPTRLLILTKLSSLIPSFTQFSQAALFLYQT